MGTDGFRRWGVETVGGAAGLAAFALRSRAAACRASWSCWAKAGSVASQRQAVAGCTPAATAARRSVNPARLADTSADTAVSRLTGRHAIGATPKTLTFLKRGRRWDDSSAPRRFRRHSSPSRTCEDRPPKWDAGCTSENPTLSDTSGPDYSHPWPTTPRRRTQRH
jgi:uncharacterized protein (DUF2342 family)